jgi:hypothetical protein
MGFGDLGALFKNGCFPARYASARHKRNEGEFRPIRAPGIGLKNPSPSASSGISAGQLSSRFCEAEEVSKVTPDEGARRWMHQREKPLLSESRLAQRVLTEVDVIGERRTQ